MISISEVSSEADLAAAILLMKEYLSQIPSNVCCVAGSVETEIKSEYSHPTGSIVLARSGVEAVGMAAFRKLDAEVCEMKRLYVRSAFRRRGISRMLVADILKKATQAGYRKMRLDTLRTMDAAIALYISFGWFEIEPYNSNPADQVRFFERKLA